MAKLEEDYKEEYKVGDFVKDYFYGEIGLVVSIDSYGWPVVFFYDPIINRCEIEEMSPDALDKASTTIKRKRTFKKYLRIAHKAQSIDNLTYVELLEVLK